LSDSGPAISHDKAYSDFFTNANAVLNELVGEAKADIHIEHDPDWKVFPEVGEAIQRAGAEENCYAVAKLPTLGLWAVGLGGGWKAREASSRLALAVAAAQATGRADEISAQFQEFGMVCAAAGIAAAPAKRRRQGSWGGWGGW